MNRIKLLRLQSGIKQEELAKIINVSQASLSGYENKKYEPDQRTLLKLAAYFNVTIDYLLGNDISSVISSKQGVKIPVLRYIRFNKLTEPDLLKTELLDYDDVHQDNGLGAYFGLQVQGDDMEPRIQAGDIVIVRRQVSVENGDIVVVQIEKNDATVKKITKYDRGIILSSYNPKYNPVVYSNEQVNSLPIYVMGKVVELRGKC